MRKTKRVVVITLLTGVLFLTFTCLAACSDTSPSSTTTTAMSSSSTTVSTASSPAGSTNTERSATPSTERIIVGGKSKEEYEAALPELEAAAAASPTDLAALQELAIAQYNVGRYQEAAATYEKMLEIEDSAVLRNRYGNVLRDMQKWEEAKAQYQKAISLDPSHAMAYVNLAAILHSQGKTEEAIALLDQGIAHTTGDDKTWLETYRELLTTASTTTTT